jgi:DNA-binding transcriptional regulator YiaG
MTGAEVRRIRRRLGLTQVELAARIGVHWNSVARWERDVVRITEPVARLLRLLAKQPKP